MQSWAYVWLVENDTIDKDAEKIKAGIRQCKFDRVRFCFKGKEECPFLHVEEICKNYMANGYCNNITCITRHPRNCRYYKRGYCRNSDCRYFHRTGTGMETRQCDKCDKKSHHTHYCEADFEDPKQSEILIERKNIHL